MMMKWDCNSIKNSRGVTKAEFSISDLYDLLQVSSKKIDRVRESMLTIGWTDISWTYARPENHNEVCGHEISSLWSFEINKRYGRNGSTVILYPADELIPTGQLLYTCASDCVKLQRPHSRALYWNLMGVEHLRGNLDTFRYYCNSNLRDKQWGEQFEYVLAEIGALKNVQIEKIDDEWIITPPMGVSKGKNAKPQN